MGDTILKTLPIFITILATVSYASNKPLLDLSWVDAQIEAIKPPRKGVPLRKIQLLKEPFVYLKKDEEKEKEMKEKKEQEPSLVPTIQTTLKDVEKKKPVKTDPLELKAILNKTALIGNKWYKLGQQVKGYTIVRITLKDVYLEKGSKRIRLTTDTIKKRKTGR